MKEDTLRFTHVAVTGLCLALHVSFAIAEDKKAEKQMDPQAVVEMYQKLAMPGEPHTLLASLAGSWTTITKSWMEPDKPPIESTGSVEMKMLLNGRFLQQEFTGEMMGQAFSGIGINAYANIRKDTLRPGWIP